jgi:hypothetical protein
LVPDVPIDGEIRRVHIQLQVVWQAIVEFEIGGILPEFRVLKLESVRFI